MGKITWMSDNQLQIVPISRNKKITGTHLPTVLGIHPYATPFEAWCRCTRTYEKPFEGNKYTNAGQIIEPKVFDFLRTSMGFGDRLITPTDVYGENHFQKTWGDFFPQQPIFGGSWDALIVDENGKVEYVVEIKTVQVDGRSGDLSERWKGGEAPHYQALQAALYAYLLRVDKVLMVSVSLWDKKGDYEHPETVIPSFANENVHIDEFRVSERYPNFDMYIRKAELWWQNHVLSGVSPVFDEKKDAEILKALRTNAVEPETDIAELVSEAETLSAEISKVLSTIEDKEKRLKAVQERIKEHALGHFRDGDTKVSIKGKNTEYIVSKTTTTSIDTESLEKDGLLGKYAKSNIIYKLTKSKIKED